MPCGHVRAARYNTLVEQVARGTERHTTECSRHNRPDFHTNKRIEDQVRYCWKGLSGNLLMLQTPLLRLGIPVAEQAV